MNYPGIRGSLAALGIAVSTGLAAPAVVSGAEDRYVMAGTLLDRGAYAEAILVYQALLETNLRLDDFKRSRILNNIGYANYKLKNLDGARKYFELALDIDSDYSTCLNNMGVVLINKKRFADALLYLERAYRLERTVKVVFNLFATHYYMGRQREALSFVEEALRLDERYTEARLKARNIKQSDIEKLKRRIK